MTKQWKGKTRGGTLGYLFFIYVIKYLGIITAYGFLSVVVVYFIPFAPKATASIWYYARHILKLNIISSTIFLFRNYYRMGQILIDKVAIGNGLENRYNFEFENYTNFLEQLTNNNGAIIIGAHIGNWEIGTPFFKNFEKKLNIVLYDAEYIKIKEILEKHTSNSNYNIIPVNSDGLMHVFSIKHALDNNECVCFQGDRYINNEKLLRCSFMGKEAKFPAGLFTLASRMKVPIIFYFAMRKQRRTYRFYFKVAQPFTNNKTDLKPEQVLLEQYTKTLEEILAKYPEQWFNYYQFWN